MIVRVTLIAAAMAGALGQVLAEDVHSPRAADVAGQIQALVEADWIDADRRFSAANTAPGRPAEANAQGVTTAEDAAGAVDGIKNGKFGFHVAVGETDPWWDVEVYGAADPKKNIALGKPTDQKSVSRHSRRGAISEPAAAQAPAGGGFRLAHTREVVRRAHGLATRLRASADPRRLDPLVASLCKLDLRLADLEAGPEAPEAIRKEMYFESRRLLRRIAFSNPVLDFDKLLFIKRHRGSLPHICDQYYGFTAVPGGGLFVLADPFGDHPKLIDLLEDSVVGNGRLRGRKLAAGAFLSPEVSYDGKTVLFAHSENSQPMRSWDEVWPPSKSSRRWTPGNCYHVFRVGADGAGLAQLTDGPWDDFDPCFLPSGRIAFISERRGGYVRCGVRACRSFNLSSMKPDGSDIVLLSYFDTNEWHPSVNNEGMIVFTRWDYIDRNTQIAHHLWTCYPDGRDARAPHGNYPVQRSDRPWAELSIRAIPGSQRYVATAAPHHGYAFGSLVWIDLRRPDDNANSQITRLTPEVPFPEGEGAIRENEVYGTPWPLSEDDYLCVYDPLAENHGVYWIDRFGNKELIYRDPAISCLSPIPLRPRPRPPVIPEKTAQPVVADEAGRGDRPATIALMNVYDSDFQWPQGTKITQLRVLQILPKSIPSRNTPRIGVAEQTNARAVLGAAAVESDGSAYFEAPPGRLICFQALDSRGMAVQSMRSGAYVHAGEHLTCQGCHEPKHRPPSRAANVPLALRRPPSKLQPDAEGSNPFNYVRLVQPVLDRHCVTCHRKENALDLTGQIQYRPCPRDKHKQCCYTRSYNNLAEKYGFCFHAHSETTIANIETVREAASRTIAGNFGARAARLLDYLDQRHYGVKLPDEDFHRIALWLDCNSDFLGAYEEAEAQARGELVRPGWQ